MTGERPITRETAAVHAGPLPGRVDVAIVGGGAIGVFAALFLAREGVSVAVFEKGVVAGEQSSRNWGWIRQQGRDEAELPIMMEANRLWREVDAELGGATGLKECGVLYIASSEGELRKLEEWLPVARRHGLDTRMLGRAELDALVDRRGSNAPRHEWVGAMHTPGDLRAEPWKAIPAVAGLAARSGAIIRERCAVRLIETRNGAVSGVVTEAGRVACHAVIVAGGAWSSLLLRRHGIAIPQLAVKSIVARTAPMPEVFGGCAVDEQLAFRRRQDGGYSLALNDWHEHFVGPDSFRNLLQFLPTLKASLGITRLLPMAPSGFPDAWSTARNWDADAITPFERCRVLEPRATGRAVETMRTRFAARFPHLGQPEILNAWAGMIDTMPDIVPVVDHALQMTGLIVATGMSGHGFGISPGFGRILADMVRGRNAGHDMSRFAFARFRAGWARPGPSL